MIKDIQEVFAKILKIDPNTIQESSTMDDVENWTSLNHLIVIMELEKKFNVKLKTNEMRDLVSIEKIITLLKKKKAAGHAA